MIYRNHIESILHCFGMMQERFFERVQRAHYNLARGRRSPVRWPFCELVRTYIIYNFRTSRIVIVFKAKKMTIVDLHSKWRDCIKQTISENVM